ncbi:MAG: MFS transporter [Nitrosomonadales bacterium]|nr:MFS transporter [Nitrosomonadales bacterium]
MSHHLTLSTKDENRLLLTLAGIQFTHILDFMIIMPLGPMLMRAFDLTTGQFGLLVSVYTFTAAASAILTATVIERFNRRHVILFSYAAFIVATALCAAAPSYALLLIARSMAGAFGGVLGAMILTFVGDTIPYERRGKATGIVMSAFSASTVFGVPLGLLFVHQIPALGWRAPFLFAAFLGLIFWGLAYRAIPSIPTRLADRRLSRMLAPMLKVLTFPNHWRAYGFMLLMMMGGFTVIPFIALYSTTNLGYPENYLSVLYLAGGACTIFTGRYFGHLADKYGKARVFRIIALCSLLPILAITNTPALPMWGLLFITTWFFILVSGRFVPGMAVITSACIPSLRGTFMSMNSAVQSAGAAIASLLAGHIITRNPQGLIEHYNLVGYLACTSTLIAIWLVTSVKPEHGEGNA